MQGSGRITVAFTVSHISTFIICSHAALGDVEKIMCNYFQGPSGKGGSLQLLLSPHPVGFSVGFLSDESFFAGIPLNFCSLVCKA